MWPAPPICGRLPDRDLPQLADELRREVIEVVSQTGGHLGSSLGVVELTVALHAVFDTPRDKLIWDVGHQCYPHKILTGRRHRMLTLRQAEGLSGFTKRSESDYDPFGAAHSSTSISAALGFAMAREMGQAVGDTVAVIGDGAITAGMAYEAMNHAGHLGKRLFVILNDNDMSIAPPVGAMQTYLNSIAGKGPLATLKAIAEGLEDHLPAPLREGARRAREMVSDRPGGVTLFEKLGFSYFGPVNGHDVPMLLHALRSMRGHAEGPVLLHVVTKKGCGYGPAEGADDKYHGVAKFDIATGKQHKTPANAPNYTAVFGQTLTDEAARDPRIVAITAAMPGGTGLDVMQKRFPARVFDVGIAEQHGVTFAAGLAAGGMRPFCAIYSSFLQRGYDQIVHDVALQNLPVRFMIDRAGLVGQDGATHAGAFDVMFLANLPNMTVMAAGDEADLVHMIATAAAHDDGPIALRYPRGEGMGVAMPERGQVLPIGKGRVLARGIGRRDPVFRRASVRGPGRRDDPGGRGDLGHGGGRALCQAAGYRSGRSAAPQPSQSDHRRAGLDRGFRGNGPAPPGDERPAGPGRCGAHHDAARPLHRSGLSLADVRLGRFGRRGYRRDGENHSVSGKTGKHCQSALTDHSSAAQKTARKCKLRTRFRANLC